MMSIVNLIVGSGVAALLWPFRAWTPLAGLTVVSLALALGLLAVFKIASNQRGLAAAKRQMQASLFELRLFEDDPRAVVRAVGDLVRQQVSYLRYALVPLLWMAVPLALLLAHLQGYYGYDGLRPGESAVVTVLMRAPITGPIAGPAAGPAAGPIAARPSLSLEAPSGVRVETPGVWTPSLREVAWRVAAEREGDYELRIAAPAAPSGAAGATTHGATVSKRLRVTPLIVARAVVRPAPAPWAQFQYPAEAPLPADSAIEAIAIAYPARAIELFGFPLHWIAIVLVLSSVFALACRRLFDVVI